MHLLALCLAFAPAPFLKPPASDLGRLQGAWSDEHGSEAHFEGRRMTLSRGRGAYVFEITLDADAQPRAFALRGVGGEAADGRRIQGIYRLDGDGLRMCFAASDAGRPGAFALDMPAPSRVVFTRKKP